MKHAEVGTLSSRWPLTRICRSSLRFSISHISRSSRSNVRVSWRLSKVNPDMPSVSGPKLRWVIAGVLVSIPIAQVVHIQLVVDFASCAL